MAKGSHKTWGGWETRVCWVCGERITLSRHSASFHFNGGRPFSLCGEHGSLYGIARAASHPSLDPGLDAPELP